jgi:TIR domain
MAHKVFISYAAEDKQIADAVCDALEAREIKCWYAPREPLPPPTPPTSDWQNSITLVLGLAGAFISLLVSLAVMSAFSFFNYTYLYPSQVIMRDTIVGLLLGISASELVRRRRWSIERSQLIRIFLVHGTTGALLSMSLLIPLSLFEALNSDASPFYWVRFGGNRVLSMFYLTYQKVEGSLLLAFIGFIVGLLICELRMRGQTGTTIKAGAKERHKVPHALIGLLAGVIVLFLLNQSLAHNSSSWMLTIRDTLFGALFGITLSELRPSALWSIRRGRRLIAFFAHAATAAAIAMMLSGAILSSISGWYPQYFLFYFKHPMLLSVYGFVVGTAIFTVRIIFRKVMGESQTTPQI